MAVTFVLVAFALSEILFRTVIFRDWTAVAWTVFERHPIYGTFQKPNLSVRRYNPPNYDVTNHTNSLGFRDRERGFTDDLAGIWIAGGSNTYAAFVEDDEIYPARLQALGYPNANLASEGHRMPQQVLVMRHLRALGHRPKAVLLEISVYNHLADYATDADAFDRPLPFQPAKASSTSPARAPTDELAGALRGLLKSANLSWIAIKGRLLNNSAIYCWLKVGVNAVPLLRRLTLQWGLRDDPDRFLGADPRILLRRSDGRVPPVITSTADYAAAVGDWVERNLSVPFAVVLIPSRFQLEPERLVRYAAYAGLRHETLDPALPYRAMAAALADRGVRVFAGAAAFAGAKQPLGFPDDGHMNRRAHELLARGLATWIDQTFEIEPAR
jgi:hypothetical protein